MMTMRQEPFVHEHSIVRQIWGTSDTILFIFAGAAAEFALNKAVDWLYFTGQLPSDPLGRLFSTVAYACRIVFADRQSAEQAIATIASIHAKVEDQRGTNIPDWAYRDVLFMLIDYSIRAYELLERPTNKSEKQEVMDVFYRVGCGMGLTKIPSKFDDWTRSRQEHLTADLAYSHFTTDLFKQYRKHLGPFRYRLLLEAQKLVVPTTVSELMSFNKRRYLRPFIVVYKMSRRLKMDGILKEMLLPSNYKDEINALDQLQTS